MPGKSASGTPEPVFGSDGAEAFSQRRSPDTLDLISSLGGGTVEGYPEDAGSVPAGFLFHGALSTYEQLGFSRDRKIGKHRWVVSRIVEPS